MFIFSHHENTASTMASSFSKYCLVGSLGVSTMGVGGGKGGMGTRTTQLTS